MSPPKGLKDGLIDLINSTPDDNIPRVAAVSLALAIKGTSIAEISRQGGYSRKNAYAVLSGEKESQRIKDSLSRALGFNPWA
jgi:lambda repressor-like predicted transcriptional regulator